MKHGKVLVTSFPDDDERQREYLLYPEKRTAIAERSQDLNSLNELKAFIQDKKMIFLHYKYNRTTFIEALSQSNNGDIQQCLRESNIQIGIMVRRAAISEEMKTTGIPKLHVRLELYVEKSLWCSFSAEQRNQVKF